MRLSTKGRYAVTAMMDLALHYDGGPVPLTDIAACQSISLSYLEQLFAKLRRAGLVKSVRGVHGGYLLARPAGEISIADVFKAVDERVQTLAHDDDSVEGGGEVSRELFDMWSALSLRLYEFLDDITLNDCIDRPYVRELTVQQDQQRRRR